MKDGHSHLYAENTHKVEKTGTLSAVEHYIGSAALEAEHRVLEYRKTAFHRFPVLFSILALFGSVITVFGVEQILLKVAFFARHPFLTLFIGLMVLTFTGVLYKRLS